MKRNRDVPPSATASAARNVVEPNDVSVPAPAHDVLPEQTKQNGSTRHTHADADAESTHSSAEATHSGAESTYSGAECTHSGAESTHSSGESTYSSAESTRSSAELTHPTGADAHHHAAGERKATHVDADARQRNLKRLRRIEGQVRGLHKMVEDERYCADILTQISSVHEALRSVGRELMRNHLKHCASGAIQAGEPTASAMYDELVDMMYKHSR